MKTKKSQIVPEEVHNLVFSKSKDGIRNIAHRYSFAYRLIAELYAFLKSEVIQNKYPQLADIYLNHISADKVYRAFNRKKPYGATPEFRNLLALYATDGKYDWNTLITEKFSQYKSLIDNDDEKKSTLDIGKKKHKRWKKWTVKEITEQFLSVYEKMSLNERELTLWQLGAEINKNKIEVISDLIKIHTEDNPKFPEFPPLPFYEPKFPASETYGIQVAGFSQVLLKDESTNPTGTHKDRMGWEVTINCVKFKLKEISIISSGSAAIAIQHFLKLYNANTKFNVLVDKSLNDEVKHYLDLAGCSIHEYDLSKKVLSDEQIRDLTKNPHGVDITYRETMDIHSLIYYDWMSYEILNLNPEYCFIPFGTGDLYINVLKIMNQEYNRRNYGHDKRFIEGNINILKECNFMGATSKNPLSKLDKLFSYHLPSLKKNEKFVKDLRKNKIIGNMSGIYQVEEKYVEDALKIASDQNINCEPSGIAGLALLLQMKNSIPKNKRILIVNTGKTNYTPQIPKPIYRQFI